MSHLSPLLKQASKVCVERGEGSWVFDVDGKRYLDFTSGIGVTSTGHCHPKVVAAAREQVGKIVHAQYTTVAHKPMLDLSDRLAERMPGAIDSVAFTNSGSEAVEAALRLARHATGRANIIVFDGPRAGEMRDYTAFGITPTLNHRAQPTLLRSEAVRTQVSQRAFLHVDTAMNRLGMSASDAGDFLRALEGDIQISYIMSHLACADEPDHSLNINQQQRLREVCNYAPHIPVSLANSGGIFLGPDYHHQLARPGISLYGSAPDDSASSILRPVVRWEADILQIAEIPAGSTVGYGASFRADTDMTIATIGAGYADGYPRALSNTSSVEICGVNLPVIGRVSMDLITVDISRLSLTQRESATHAILIGINYSPSQMAADTGTISYEILTGLGARLSRHYDGPS